MRAPMWTVLGALLLTSCGAPQPPISPQARAQLLADVAQVRSAAMRHDRSASDAALLTLTRDIAAAQARGELDPAYARNLLAAAERVSEDVAALPPQQAPPQVITRPAPAQRVTVPVPVPPPPAPAPAPAPSPAPAPATDTGGSSDQRAPQASQVPSPENPGNTGAGQHGKGEAPTKGQG